MEILQKERKKQLQAAMLARDSRDIEPLRTALEAGKAAALDEREDIQPAGRLLHQLEERQQLLAFTHVLREDAEALLAATSRDEVKSRLMDCMKISLDQGFQAEILTDFHYHNLAFCRQMRFSPEQSSTLLSVMATVHEKAVVKERMSVVNAFRLFEELLERHSNQRPPFNVGVFSHAEGAAIRAYARRTFFRHYKMYLFAYIRQHELSLEAVELPVAPAIPALQPLAEGHEVDASMIPELREVFGLFREDAETAALASSRPQSKERLSAVASVTPERSEVQEEISAAMDAAVQGQLGSIFERMQQVPVPGS